MYSATLGMLRSLCTSTFMPFFRVLVDTAYSCACAGAPCTPAHAHRFPAPSHFFRVFMESSWLRAHYLEPYKLRKMFSIIFVHSSHVLVLSSHYGEHSHRSARPALQLDRRRHQIRSAFRHAAQVRQILQVIQAGT